MLGIVVMGLPRYQCHHHRAIHPDSISHLHTTSEMLKRYIKADQLDVVQKLTDKYDYFD